MVWQLLGLVTTVTIGPDRSRKSPEVDSMIITVNLIGPVPVVSVRPTVSGITMMAVLMPDTIRAKKSASSVIVISSSYGVTELIALNSLRVSYVVSLAELIVYLSGTRLVSRNMAP